MNPYLATLLTFVIAVFFLRLMDFLAHRGWIESRLSRKLIHIGTGPIFVLCWLMFPDQPISRWLAALVPLVITAQFVLVGTGIIKDEAAVKAMSRAGDRREILRGPFFYGIVFIAVTLVYWKDSLIGIPALMMMCGGDGIADIDDRARVVRFHCQAQRRALRTLAQRRAIADALDEPHQVKGQRAHSAACCWRCACCMRNTSSQPR